MRCARHAAIADAQLKVRGQIRRGQVGDEIAVRIDVDDFTCVSLRGWQSELVRIVYDAAKLFQRHGVGQVPSNRAEEVPPVKGARWIASPESRFRELDG